MRNRRGLSLLEILVAFSCIAVAAIALASVFVSGLRLMTKSSEYRRATEVAREQVESVRELGYAAVPSGDFEFDGRRGDPPVDGFPPPPYPTASVGSAPVHLLVRTGAQGTLKMLEVEAFSDGARVWLETYLAP
jgi:type II secretory pathway pseudopilin PulG